MLTGVASLFRASATAKGLSLGLHLDAGLDAAVAGDAARLRQVVQNLLSNAIKFTSAGSVTLAARLRAAESERPILEIEVSDTGCGVPEAAQSRLFTRFTQADSSTTRRFGGTGLGLALCRELIGAMGGEIGYRPAAGGGACFWFSLTLCAADGAAPRYADASAAAATARLKGARILAVDDNATNRFVLKTLLEAVGCATTLAADGQEALNLVRDHAFDAILMDVHMPVLDGLEATRAIRRLSGLAAATPIIAVTAEAMPEQIGRARAAGVDDHVTKPIQPDRLLQVLEDGGGQGQGPTRAALLERRGLRPFAVAQLALPLPRAPYTRGNPSGGGGCGIRSWDGPGRRSRASGSGR